MEHHATLSPSSLDARKHCPQYVSAPRETEFTAAGTVDHAALAAFVAEIIQKRPAAQPWQTGVPAERREEILWAGRWIQANMDPKTIEAEARVCVFDEEFNLVSFGTADVVDAYSLADYKSGQLRDYAAQMAFYALGRMQQLSKTHYRVTILFGQLQRAEDYVLTIEEAGAIVWPIIRDVLAGGPPRPCSYCKWCDKALTCGATTAPIAGAIEKLVPEQLRFDPAKLSDPEQLSRALEVWRDYLKPWGELLWSGTIERAKAGKLPAGVNWELTASEGRSKIADVAGAFQALGMPQELFLQCCDLRLDETKAKFAEFHGLPRTRAAAEVKRRLKNLSSQPPQKYSLKKTNEKATHEDDDNNNA